MLSALGLSVEEHWQALMESRSGITVNKYPFGDFHVGKIDEHKFQLACDQHLIPSEISRFEKLIILSIKKCFGAAIETFIDSDVPLIIASTKGNIAALENYVQSGDTAVHLINSAKNIQQYFRLRRRPIILSNACSSALQAIAMAYRLIQANAHQQVVVCGVDELAEFTLRGFDCLHAYAPDRCRPFDARRTGINLGEGAATLVLSSKPADIQIAGVGVSNDANHISGPARDGAGLQRAVRGAQASCSQPIDAIHAHGTATKYNDEMEAQAFHALDLHKCPTTSLKGYIGHTLGASGALESAAAIMAMQHNQLFSSLGYEQHGLTLPLNVVQENATNPLQTVLKTSSGFGGSNAAIIYTKSPAHV